MIKHRILAVAAATTLVVAAAHAGEKQAASSSAPPAAESPRAPSRDAQASGGVSFTRDVKQAWAQAREDGRHAGHAIGDGARSFGRATRDAAVNGWRKVKEAFSS
jgi:hypothetical protein